MDIAINVAASSLMLSSALVVVGLIGKLLVRDVPLEELRTSSLWRSDRAAWAVRLLRPAVVTMLVSGTAFVALLTVDAI